MHTHSLTNLESLNKRLPDRKLMTTVFWDRKMSADGGIHAKNDRNKVKSVLRNIKSA
jgi:hypothetical protein